MNIRQLNNTDVESYRAIRIKAMNESPDSFSVDILTSGE